MLDMDLINVEALQEVRSIGIDDEGWWMEIYAPKFEQPTCTVTVGESLVVQFAYSLTYEKVIESESLKTSLGKKLEN